MDLHSLEHHVVNEILKTCIAGRKTHKLFRTNILQIICKDNIKSSKVQFKPFSKIEAWAILKCFTTGWWVEKLPKT